jgi:hypothetical protein
MLIYFCCKNIYLLIYIYVAFSFSSDLNNYNGNKVLDFKY